MDKTEAKRKKIATTPIFQMVQEAYDKHFVNACFQGGSRSGKTYNIVMWLIIHAMRNPNVKIAVVRQTRPAIESSSFEDFKSIMLDMGLWSERNLNVTKLCYTFENGSRVEFFGCDDEQRVRGRKRDILFCNEANELSLDVWNQLKMRTTRFTICDFNPSFDDEHWLVNVNNDYDKTYFKITTYKDNPFLEQEIIDWIESYKDTNESMWRIYGLGLQSIVEGLVFPKYELVKKWPTWVKNTYIGVDFGFTNDPTAIVKVGLYRDEIYIQEIAYARGMFTEDIIKMLKQPQCKGYQIISESADPRLVREIARSGLHITPVKKGGRTPSILAGIEAIQSKKIFITEKSVNVEKEIRNYTFSQGKDGTWSNIPIDKWNHAMDAIRYVVYTKGMNKRKGLRYRR